MKTRVTIIGGGAAGLAAAFALSRDGYAVELFEASEELFGLAASFQLGDHWIDKFYHCIMPTDDSLLALVDAVGLREDLYWAKTRMGFAIDGVRYPFNTPMDLLSFTPLSLPNRIRLGAMSLLARSLGKGLDLDAIRVEDWFLKLYGRRIWERIFLPLFRAKFGDHAANTPALYIWQRMGREKNVATRGYLTVGFRGLANALEAAITRNGGVIHRSAPVVSIDSDEDGAVAVLASGEQVRSQWLIVTTPTPVLEEMMAGGSLGERLQQPPLLYQGVVNTLFFLKRPLDGYYWMPVVDSGTEFDGVVEMSQLVRPEQYGGLHLAYTMKYCQRSQPLFQEPEAHIAARWQAQLLALYQDIGLREEDIACVKVFKTPYVDPIYPLGFSKQQPPMHIPGSRVLLANSPQVYPDIFSCNSSVAMSNRAVAMLRDLDAHAAATQ